MNDDDDDMSEAHAKLAALMNGLEDAEEMSDAKLAALKDATAKLARDLDDDLEGEPAGPKREVLATLREVQILSDRLLALADRKQRPN